MMTFIKQETNKEAEETDAQTEEVNTERVYFVQKKCLKITEYDIDRKSH